jgi:hypothetical protein
MTYGNDKDYQPPFSDVRGETPGEAIGRVVAIGAPALTAWWARVKDDTSPGTYGETGHEFAGSVAYISSGGRVARRHADKFAPRFEAARLLGVEINWV